MISDKKEQSKIVTEKQRLLDTINIVKEKRSYMLWLTVPIGLISLLLSISIYSLNMKAVEKITFLSVLGCLGKSVLVFLIAFSAFLIIEYFLFRKQIIPRTEIITGTKDDREFRYSDEHPYGTARPNTAEDLDDILEFKDIEDTYGTILGYDANIDKVVSIPTIEEFAKKAKDRNWTQEDKTNNSRNRNALIIGSPGTMKSRAIIMNEIFQSIRAGESIIVTDPKGDLYEKTYNVLVENGYYVKMFNLIKQENSDSSNLVSELNGDSTYAKIFAETLVTNANEDGEQYWNDNAMNFIKACLMLDSIGTLGKLYDFVSGKTLEEFDNIFTDSNTNKVASRAYKIFSQCSDQVKGQIINGLGIMIDVFQDDKVRNITNTNEMDLTRPAKEKCAYFVITSDQHRTFDYLAVLFWTMAFIKLVEYIDDNRDNKGDPITNPVHLLLDEFPNIGAIPDFNRKLSTVRSRLLYSTIVIQNIPQLMNRYPNGMHEEIFSDCDFVVFLGCNDNTTAEYISKLTGIASILVETENHVFDKSKLFLDQDTEMRKVKSIGQRTVMNPDEVRSIYNTDCLIFIRGIKSVYQCKKYDYSKHPFNKKIKVCKITDHIPDWRQKQIDEENERLRKIEERKRAAQEEKERQAEILKQAKEKEKLEQEIRKKTLENEETEWLSKMNSEQLDFESVNKRLEFLNNQSTNENSDDEDNENIVETDEMEKSDVLEISFDTETTDTGLYDDMSAMLNGIANNFDTSNNKTSGKKTLSRKRREPIVINNSSDEEDAA